MNYKLVILISFTSFFMILTIIPEWNMSINAQNNSFKNSSSSGVITEFEGSNSSIITPWNTGNDKNNDTSVPNFG